MAETLEDLRDLLTVRTFNALRWAQRRMAADVLRLSDRDVLLLRHVGRFCLRDLRRAQAVWRSRNPLTWEESHPLHQEP